VPNLVDSGQLLEANSKMQTARATGAIAGPAIAGVLIGLITAPVVLSLDAVTYLFSAAGLASIRKPEPAPQLPEARTSLWRQLAEGFRAVYGGRLPHGAGPVTMVILVTAQFLYGVAITVFNMNTITLRQMITPRRLLARMNATYRLLLFGMPPLGALIGGFLGAALGLRESLLITLIALMSPMLWLLHSPVFRIHDIPAGPDDQPAEVAPAAAPATAKDGTADD
jgi:hypothetical protein